MVLGAAGARVETPNLGMKFSASKPMQPQAIEDRHGHWLRRRTP